MASDDSEEAFERAVRESVAAREDASLVEIRELSARSALVVVEQAVESTPSLYRIERHPDLDNETDLTWEYLGEAET